MKSIILNAITAFVTFIFIGSSNVVTNNTNEKNENVSFKEESIELKTENGFLKGTVTIPADLSSKKAVLIIAGSGPTDRDGNTPIVSGDNDSLKLIAYSLAEKGIASIRYDKRGIGESANLVQKEEDLVFEDYINDAVEWVKLLQKDDRFSKVIVLGHSEGALIGMVAAERGKADGFISVAGMGSTYYDTLKRQLQGQPKNIYDECLGIMDELKRGNQVVNVSNYLYPLFRPSVQPYLISAFKYDPVLEIKKLKIPVLILQGTTDLQVTIEDAKALKEAKPDAELEIIDGMNHILKEAPSDPKKNMETYQDPKLPLLSTFVDKVLEFIFNIK